MVEIPQDGFIKETINWEASVPNHGIVAHTFYLISVYGVGTTAQEILSNSFIIVGQPITTVSMSRTDYITTYIAPDIPVGTYSCATFIAEGWDGNIIEPIYDSKVDANVLIIVPGLGARIVSTLFTQI